MKQKNQNCKRNKYIRQLELKCHRILTALAPEELDEVQSIIDEVWGYESIDDAQIPQALELMLEILEDFTNEKRKVEALSIIHLPTYIKPSSTPYRSSNRFTYPESAEIEYANETTPEYCIDQDNIAANMKQVNGVYMLGCCYNNENEATKGHEYETYANRAGNLEAGDKGNAFKEDESWEQGCDVWKALKTEANRESERSCLNSKVDDGKDDKNQTTATDNKGNKVTKINGYCNGNDGTVKEKTIIDIKEKARKFVSKVERVLNKSKVEMRTLTGPLEAICDTWNKKVKEFRKMISENEKPKKELTYQDNKRRIENDMVKEFTHTTDPPSRKVEKKAPSPKELVTAVKVWTLFHEAGYIDRRKNLRSQDVNTKRKKDFEPVFSYWIGPRIFDPGGEALLILLIRF
ncbi:1908_t:CDS:2 [Racocetra persica]|uniref:1908_t:CDS:1 n=1 Tax=Racocetra persica TaxID=160502 RepID=A0ACA9M3X3_9GLOM|nr:1908_t:CDS:2 [Racocetra persica]